MAKIIRSADLPYEEPTAPEAVGVLAILTGIRDRSQTDEELLRRGLSFATPSTRTVSGPMAPAASWMWMRYEDLHMISWTQIAVAAVIIGVGVGLAARGARWPTSWAILAGGAAVVSIVAWRALSNRLGLNGDFIPAVSPADVGSFVAGAIGSMVRLPFVGGNRSREWLPAVVGGIVGFVANVVVL